MKIIRYY